MAGTFSPFMCTNTNTLLDVLCGVIVNVTPLSANPNVAFVAVVSVEKFNT